jgi:chemotaxis protein MotA
MNKGGMDIATWLGITMGFGTLIFGFVIEGGNPAALVGISPIIIIAGGTIGALMTSFTIKDVLNIPNLIMEANKLSPDVTKDNLEVLITFSEKARREGLLSLESDIQDLNDRFLQKGLKLAVDGTDPEIIRSVLENDIYLFELRKKEEAAIFDTAGGFSPTMGIIGTVMGLVLVLSHLGGSGEELGHSIAVAFIATLYGIGLANLFWLPVGNKLKLKLKKEKLQKELIIVSVLSMLAGENPSILRDKLEGFLEGKELKAFQEQGPAK